MEQQAGDIHEKRFDIAWSIRCMNRRLNVANSLVSALPRLKRCSFLALSREGEGAHTMYRFVVRGENSEKGRAACGVKQWWMSHVREGENLPEDMVSELDIDNISNDPNLPEWLRSLMVSCL